MRLLPGLILLWEIAVSAPASAVTLEFWHTWPHAGATVRNLANSYTRRTGVQVRIRVLRPSPRVALPSRGGPDIVGLYRPTKRDIERMAASGRIQDIQPEMSRGWYSTFWSGMLESFTSRRGARTSVYGVPLTGQVRVFVYNTELFRKAGISPPRSWALMLAAVQQLRRLGVTPYAGGFGSNMPPLAATYERSYLGLHELMQTYYGRYRYTASDWLAYLSLYVEMRRYGFTNPASATTTETSAMKSLIDGRVAMVFVDASFDSVRRAYRPSFASWGLFAAPADRRARFLPRLPGGVVEGLVISRRSPRRAAALAFARWLTEHNQQVAFANGTSAIPAAISASSSPQLRQYLRSFAAVGMRDQSIDVRIYESSAVLSTFYTGVRGILASTSTPLETARRAQAAKGR